MRSQSAPSPPLRAERGGVRWGVRSAVNPPNPVLAPLGPPSPPARGRRGIRAQHALRRQMQDMHPADSNLLDVARAGAALALLLRLLGAGAIAGVFAAVASGVLLQQRLHVVGMLCLDLEDALDQPARRRIV